MEKVTGTSGAATLDAAAQTSQATEVKQPVVQVDGQSTIASAKEPEERGFFGSVVDRVAGVFSWIKDKIVAFFSYIFCCSTDATINEEISKLADRKILVDNARTAFIKIRNEDTSVDKKAFKDQWKTAFAALPQDLQDELVKEDIRKLAQEKGNDAAQVEAAVENGFKDEAIRNKSLSFIRDLTVLTYKETIPAEYYSAADDKYIPSYLQHIAANIANRISALKEAAK